MKRQTAWFIYTFVASMPLWFSGTTALGTDSPATQPTPPASGKGTPPLATTPVYKPPMRGAPGGRVGGGTRSKDQVFTLSVLAPNHTGLTSQDQPVLYWFVSKPLSSPIEFTLIDSSATPLLEKVLAPPGRKGIQRLPLSEFGVRLESGKQYQWFLTFVSDPKRRSKDVLAGATIERLPLSNEVAEEVSKLDGVSAANRYAEVGHWYDAIASLSEQIEANPLDSNLRTQRAALLQQVGLHEIADYDLHSLTDK
jgi:hypothetical protein